MEGKASAQTELSLSFYIKHKSIILFRGTEIFFHGYIVEAMKIQMQMKGGFRYILNCVFLFGSPR